MPTSTDFMSSAEACELLSVDRSTLTRWVAAGLIRPAMKAPGLRGAYFFERAEVERVKEATAMPDREAAS